MERKEIIKLLGEHFGVKPKYMGVPSFAYQIATAEETYTVDRAGKIITSEGNEVELETLLNARKIEEAIDPTTTETTVFDITVPMEGHTGISLRNLVNMIYSKQVFIMKAFVLEDNIIEDDLFMDINNAKIETVEDFKKALESTSARWCTRIVFDFSYKTITFKFLEGDVSPEKIRAYSQFVALLNQSAKTLKYVSAKFKDADNDKFTFRVFLIRIGMVGDEYKTARKVLLEKLEGNSAFRSGRKHERIEIVTDETPEQIEGDDVGNGKAD